MATMSAAARAMAATAEFRAGGNAYRAGKALTDNPHACPGTAWERWHYGWMAAEEDELEGGE